MAKKYVFNQHTLSYEVVRLPLKKRILHFLAITTTILVSYTAVIFIYSHFFDTPKAVLLKQSNEDLLVKYKLMTKMFQEKDMELNELMQRDNMVYRSIFETDIIPLSIRESGLGDIGRYEHLLTNEQTITATQALMLMDKVTKKAYIQSKSLDEIALFTLQKEQMIDCIPSIQPIPISNPRVRISALYGPRKDPIYRSMNMHHGIDLAGPLGTSVHATGNGKVIEARFSIHGYGNTVLVDHGFGYRTRYAHLDKINVKKGDAVKRGEVVGLLGNTGKSTGPHLHYEVIYRRNTVNPINFFSDDISIEEFDRIITAVSTNNSEELGMGYDDL
jgi:hypothetical protein